MEKTDKVRITGKETDITFLLKHEYYSLYRRKKYS
jgi:hypothetical protein